MPLANLWRPQPGLDGWEVYWFNNWIDHQEIQQAIEKQLKVNQVIYIIQPWDNTDAAGILQRHQQFHNDMNAALNTAGQDLSELDVKDQAAVQAWVYQHYLEHQQVREALGI